MSTPSKTRLPVSSVNAVLLAVLVGWSIIMAALGGWFEAGLLAVIAAAVLASALYARRPESRDITRVNAIEYRDERDRRIAQIGFSAVGAAALIISIGGCITAVVAVNSYHWPPGVVTLLTGQLLLLCAVWGIANSVAARRS